MIGWHLPFAVFYHALYHMVADYDLKAMLLVDCALAAYGNLLRRDDFGLLVYYVKAGQLSYFADLLNGYWSSLLPPSVVVVDVIDYLYY